VVLIVAIVLDVKYIRLRKQSDETVNNLSGKVYKDELTDLFNRRYFDERIPSQLERASRSGAPASLILLDIDHFKLVNDTYGHAAGDIVLKNLGEVLKNSLRGYDVPVRFGGEEFTIYMPDIDGSRAKISAERIRRSIEKINSVYKGQEIRITCSFGIASVISGTATLEELLELADKAMYEAKTTGRNRICVAPPIDRGEDQRIAEFIRQHEEQRRTTIRLDLLARVLSQVFDKVESRVYGVSEHHSLRVAAICSAMGKKLGYSDDSLISLTICALFHDNALSEYLQAIADGKTEVESMQIHCESGQRNIEMLPFVNSVKNYIRCHHECADGSGLFGEKEGEYPREAGLISIADKLDTDYHLESVDVSKLPELHAYIGKLTERGFNPYDVKLLDSVIDEDMITALKNENINTTLDVAVPIWIVSRSDECLNRISEMLTGIDDSALAEAYSAMDRLAAEGVLNEETIADMKQVLTHQKEV
jgi:diguanylate cyclase (GGDEF)-like protein